MKDKIVLITGGTRGLGKEIAGLFIDQQAKVVVIDLAAPESLPEAYRNALFDYRRVNLADHQALEHAFASIIQKTGNRLDILVNNAWPRSFKPFQSFSSNEISAFLDAGLKASFLLVNWAIRLMAENGYGRIVQISSQSAFKGYSSGTLYCSTKMALITFHESLSRELRKSDGDIALLTICPDSFGEMEGKVYANGAQVMKSIGNRIERFVREGRSSVVYIGSKKTRGWLLAQLLEKIKYIVNA